MPMCGGDRKELVGLSGKDAEHNGQLVTLLSTDDFEKRSETGSSFSGLVVNMYSLKAWRISRRIHLAPKLKTGPVYDAKNCYYAFHSAPKLKTGPMYNANNCYCALGRWIVKLETVKQ